MNTRTISSKIAWSLLVAGLVLVTLLTGHVGSIYGQRDAMPGDPLPQTDPSPTITTGDTVIVPSDAFPFFTLTAQPEPLAENDTNGSVTCQPDALLAVRDVQQVDGITYLALQCPGAPAIGWTDARRVAGPVHMQRGDRAVWSGSGEDLPVIYSRDFKTLVDVSVCPTIVKINSVSARDLDDDNYPDLLYFIDCADSDVGSIGWTEADYLAGPLVVSPGEYAAALDGLTLYDQPGPAAAAQPVDSACAADDLLIMQDYTLVDGTLYYAMQCGDRSGWVTSDQFRGPLRYRLGDSALAIPAPITVCEDALNDAGGIDVLTPGEIWALALDDPLATDCRQTRITPPLPLTTAPVSLFSDEAAAMIDGACPTGAIAQVLDWSAADTLYYHIACVTCPEMGPLDYEYAFCEGSDLTAAGTGWIAAQYLKGPLAFTIGDLIGPSPYARVLETDEYDQLWIHLPTTLLGAAAVGQYTVYAGRCDISTPLQVIGVQMEKRRTSDDYDTYYRVQCTGQSGEQILINDGEGDHPEMIYHDDNAVLQGYVAARSGTLLPWAEVEATLRTRPDLLVTAIEGPGTVTLGSSGTARAEYHVIIHNAGDQAAGPFTVEVGAVTLDVNGLGPHEDMRIPAAGSLYMDFTGTGPARMMVHIDRENTVPEANETNNTFGIIVTVQE